MKQHPQRVRSTLKRTDCSGFQLQDAFLFQPLPRLELAVGKKEEKKKQNHTGRDRGRVCGRDAGAGQGLSGCCAGQGGEPPSLTGPPSLPGPQASAGFPQPSQGSVAPEHPVQAAGGLGGGGCRPTGLRTCPAHSSAGPQSGTARGPSLACHSLCRFLSPAPPKSRDAGCGLSLAGLLLPGASPPTVLPPISAFPLRCISSPFPARLARTWLCPGP